MQLRVDGIVILNTGDSLVALQVDTKLPIQSFDDAGRLSAKLSGKNGLNAEERSGTILGADLSILGTVTTYYTQECSDERIAENSVQKRKCGSGSSMCEISATGSDGEEENFYSPDFSENSDNDQGDIVKGGGEEKVQRSCEKCRSPLKGNSQCCCSLLVVSSHRPALRAKNEGNTNNSENVKNGNGGSSHFVSSHECLSPKSPKSPKSSSGHSDNARSPHSVCPHVGPIAVEKASSQMSSFDRDTQTHCLCNTAGGLHSPLPAIIHSPTFEVCGNKNGSNDQDDNVACSSSRLSSSQRSFFSSASSSGDGGSRSQSSESVIVHTNYARTLTFSVRRFAIGSEELLDSPQLAEGNVKTKDLIILIVSNNLFFYLFYYCLN